MQGFDLVHQVWRLRNAKNMSDTEAELIMRTILENVQSYEQVVEVGTQAFIATCSNHIIASCLLSTSFGWSAAAEFRSLPPARINQGHDGRIT